MVNERRLDSDEFVEFVARETDDADLTGIIKDLLDKYLKRNVPQVTVGQEVWGIRGYATKWRVAKGHIAKVQLKKRYSFVIHYDGTERSAAYSKNSIGRLVFFTEEEAEKAIRQKNA